MSVQDDEARTGGDPWIAVIAAIGVLGLAVWLLFGDSSSPDDDVVQSRTDAANSRGGGDARGQLGGVQSRAMDDPSRRERRQGFGQAAAVQGGGMAPTIPEPEEPPTFANKAEEIAYYERKLAIANEQLEHREQFLQRAEKQRQELEAEGDLDAIDAREPKWKIVRRNRDRAQKRVDDIQRKLDELRG